ncbi:PAS domain-containing protein [Gillisia sp. JM1]|uniref:PAS domain-containing protein n=1 Tax=Gillisia sp. JM1 TaxID=1283286 RepID=UPI0004105D90|nr:PAS domain-containing protein [Gillisia sp. JM1]
MVKAFAEKANWKNEIGTIFKNRDFDALIITNIDQKILWVNDGFTQMTGYSKKLALNKTPNFLQGINTSITIKNKIRNKLNNLKPFTEIITNYRKDNSSYECEVKIIPMYVENVTHFLAIEKQIV